VPRWDAEVWLDIDIGIVLVVLGVVATRRHPASRTGVLVLATGACWLLGDLTSALAFLHRGPLVHAVLAHPTGRSRRAGPRIVILISYAVAAIYPLAHNDPLTTVVAAMVLAEATRRFIRSAGPARPAWAAALLAAGTTAPAMVLGPATRLAGVDARTTVLADYDALVLTGVALLVVDLLRGRWSQDAVTGLVLDLGDHGTEDLRGRLARVLGDPGLLVGYWVPDAHTYVDETGRPVSVPDLASGGVGRAGRSMTPITADGGPVAVLVHDTQVLADPAVLSDVAAAAGFAVANARLQAVVRAEVANVEQSRRRLVTAADEERQHLEERLRHGPERRLATIDRLLSDASPALAALAPDVARARDTLRSLALGLHPAALTYGDLPGALHVLVARSTVPTTLSTPAAAVPPPIAAAAYFVCAEALTNTAKYGGANHADVVVELADGVLKLVVADDGSGGADASRGTGLRGLADRAEALGGTLIVRSPPGRGTRVTLRLPLSGPESPEAPPPSHPTSSGASRVPVGAGPP
jgi:signal transduction histidine kinase